MNAPADAAAPSGPGRVRRLFSLGLVYRPLDDRASGMGVARLFQNGLALLFALAWLSLGSQVLELIGSGGLLPLGETLAAVRTEQPVRLLDFPSVFLFLPGDGWLRAGPWLGVLTSVAVWLGIWPRASLAFSTFLYLSYATACRTFFAFQWDNLLLEAGFLAIFLPTHEVRRGAHVLLRLLVFKLYFESGLAKWQSPLGDWRDGSAMTFYYETAPLPTPLGFYAHHLPVAWHHLESWATLALELVGPFFIFGPPAARRLAFAGFTLFQFCDFATANYGFFCPLAAWLGIFLLGERDLANLRVGRQRFVAALLRRCPARVISAVAPAVTRARRLAQRLANLRPRGLALGPRGGRALLALAATVWILVSVVEGLALFGASGSWLDAGASLVAPAAPFRLANTYHLFTSVRRDRLEPSFEVEVAGTFAELPLRYKPGPVDRPPPFVAPHQPRVDFQLWFHGLAPRRQPAYVASLLGALCEEPSRVAWLFAVPPPAHPTAVRMSYWTTHFAGRRNAGEPRQAKPEDREPSQPRQPVQPAEDGRWWSRRLAFHSPVVRCTPAEAPGL